MPPREMPMPVRIEAQVARVLDAFGRAADKHWGWTKRAPGTTCKRGHLLTPDNILVVQADGYGRCKTCRQAAQAKYEETRRARAGGEIPSRATQKPAGGFNDETATSQNQD